MPFVCVWVHSGVMFRRSTVFDIFRYEDLPFGADYDLWLRLLFKMPQRNVTFATYPEVLVRYLLHNDSLSAQNRSLYESTMKHQQLLLL